MAQLPNPFNANDHQPAGTFEPIPAGWYKVMITESEMKKTSKGNGYYLQLSFQVVEGPHAGRILWDRLNLVNPSQTAVDIAQRTLSAICHSVGVLAVNDSAQLHNKPLQAKVKVVPATAQYSAKNEIEGYAKPDGTVPAAAAAPAQNQAAPQASQESTPAAQSEAPAQQQATSAPPPWAKAS